MADDTRFIQTVITVEVLSEGPLGVHDLTEIAEAITTGDCSGVITSEVATEVTPARMAELLIAQGSDPGFFGLDDPDGGA